MASLWRQASPRYGSRRRITGECRPAPAKHAPAKPAIQVVQPVTPKTDRFGDPLPDGAIARLGTTRLRQGEGVRNLNFSADGKTLLSADSRGVNVWDAATGRPLRRFGDPQGRQYTSIAVSQDCRTVALMRHDGVEGQIEIWDAAAGTLLRQFFAGRFPELALSPDGKTLAVRPLDGRDEKSLQLWDATSGEKRHHLRGHQAALNDFAFSGDGKTVVTASDDKSIRFWDVATGQQVRQLDHAEGVGRIALAPDGKTVASVGTAKTTQELGGGLMMVSSTRSDHVVLWDVTSGKQKQRLKGQGQKELTGLANEKNSDSVNCIAIAPDGKTLVSSDRQTTYWWDVATGKALPLQNPSVPWTPLMRLCTRRQNAGHGKKWRHPPVGRSHWQGKVSRRAFSIGCQRGCRRGGWPDIRHGG